MLPFLSFFYFSFYFSLPSTPISLPLLSFPLRSNGRVLTLSVGGRGFNSRPGHTKFLNGTRSIPAQCSSLQGYTIWLWHSRESSTTFATSRHNHAMTKITLKVAWKQLIHILFPISLTHSLSCQTTRVQAQNLTSIAVE